MDDTQQSQVSDAAATRKRRSSILKSQRPARTPFSELEFNVTTPTDTAKSRRVSFSRRTGVAEFITNEATNTFKDFYEKHNKSLESSGNDSGANASKQPVGHLGKRLFDQQFEEVEAVDFTSLHPTNSNGSLSNVNFADQLASLENTADGKLTAPLNNFELTALTDHQSRLFGNDFTVPCASEVSGRIDVNFSAMQQIGNDDLDDIERDLEMKSNHMCQGPFERQNMSEYIEVDLNMTHVAMTNDDDMSITDTIHSPKVQEVSKGKKDCETYEWVVDKENIAINPYAATKESDNFAVNDEPDQVLVFDGKRLTIQSEKVERDKNKDYRRTLLPNSSAETPQRKTIILNVNDDLPNFIDDVLNSKCDNSEFSGVQELKSSTLYSEHNHSKTLPVNRVEIMPKRKAFLDTTGNISITQAVPTNIFIDHADFGDAVSEKRRTIVYEEESGNISVTQALPAKILTSTAKAPERRRTVVYENDTGNISITQAVPSNILVNENAESNERRKTIVFDDDGGNISVTQVISSNIILADKREKRKTIVFDDNYGNVSITQAVPANIVLSDRQLQEKRRTIIYGDDTGNISVTQALPRNFLLAQDVDRRRTVVYEDDSGNISVTQAVPSKIDLEREENRDDVIVSKAHGQSSNAVPTDIILKSSDSTKRRTILYEEDTCNISITQAVPSNVIHGISESRSYVISSFINKPTDSNTCGKVSEKRKTIIYDNDCDISVTQAIPSNIILPDETKRKTILFDNDTTNISITQAIPERVFLVNKIDSAVDVEHKITNSVEESDKSSPVCVSPLNTLDTVVEDSDAVSVNENETDERTSEASYEIRECSSEVNDIMLVNTDAESVQSIPTTVSNLDKLDSAVEFSDKMSESNEASERSVPVSQYLLDNLDSAVDISNRTTERIKMPNAKPVPGQVFLLDNHDTLINISFKTKNSEKVEKPITKDTNNQIDAAADNVKMIDESEEANERAAYNNTDDQDVSMTDDVTERRKTLVIRTDECDDEMSITEAIPKVHSIIQETEKRRTIVFDNDNGNISVTKPIPANLLAFQSDILNKSKNKQVDLDQDQLAVCPDVIVYQTATTHSSTKLQPIKTDQGDTKSDRPIDSKSNSHAVVTALSKAKDEEKIINSRDYLLEDVSDDLNSLIKHPPLEGKSELLNLKPSNIEVDIARPSVANTIEPQESTVTVDLQLLDKPKDSVLNSLLDMSCTSMELGTDDKSMMAADKSNPETSEKDMSDDDTCSEHMFYITRDVDAEPSEDEDETDSDVGSGKAKTIRISDKPAIMNHSPSSLDYKEKDLGKALEKKLAELKTVTNEGKKVSAKDLYEKLVNTDLEGVVERDENVKKLRQQSISFRHANDTKELLDMISDFTDKTDDDDDPPTLIRSKCPLASATKNEATEPRRLSFAPNRQSIILSRENLLTNISLAQAALQKPRLELDESDCAEDTKDTTIDQSLSKKSTRTSSEVVKTLHFDDESMSEVSLKSDAKASPLKKTAFGETSYMSECKGKVIPTFLKDVSDGIKTLMMDLVKPMADTMPFEAGGLDKGVRRVPSTQSTQIQANLITSSQIDIESQYSPAESGYDIDKMSSYPNSGLARSRSRSFRSPVKFSTNSSEKSSEFEVPSPRQRYLYSRTPVEKKPSPAKVLVFDHHNPLNNILLGPADYTDAHKYNPKKSEETLCGSERRPAQPTYNQGPVDDDYDLDNVTTQYNMQTRLSIAMQGDRAYKNEDEKSLLNLSRPPSTDQSVDVKIMELKDIEVNTLIAMKGNKELLEASSSLTLVDDAIGQKSSDDDVKKNTTAAQDFDSSDHHKVKISRSPVEIIYKIEEQGTGPLLTETDFTSNDEEGMDKTKKSVKTKKRIYSPITDKYKTSQAPVDVTPKPNIKMQKISKTANIYRTQLEIPLMELATKMTAEKDTGPEHVGRRSPTKQEKKKSPRRSSEKKPGTSITVQQLITEYHVEAGLNHSIIDKQLLNALNSKSENSTAPTSQSDDLESNSLDVISSFTSSKNLNAMKDVMSSSTTQSRQSTLPSKTSRVDWHPDLVTALSSKQLSHSDSSMNVVAKIDMLPFMGSHECEWESSSADTWSFRLLHGRLRLTARLAHRHDNSTRTRVRGDTPVLDVSVETVQHDKKNPVATLCVRFAGETMRYMVSRACRNACYASDIPPLLRRCAAVARVALRWGRAMHDAKLHLAYTLDNDGYLTLKVANIPLRSVWEVSMRVELVVDDAREAPWPRAGGVRVARVVSDVCVADADVRRALAHTPRDWGHAPRTIWRMFRYLKHKTRDDDLLLGA